METDGQFPMPWPWEMCTHCMDLRSGMFMQWPRGAIWEDNQKLLGHMQVVWRAWQFFSRTQDTQYKWTTSDLNYDNWLEEGRPEREPAKSEYQVWAEAQNERSET